MKYIIETIENWDELANLKNDWQALCSLSKYNTLFQRYKWHESWWLAHRENHNPLILIAKHNGETIGIGAFMQNSSGAIEFLGSPETEYQNIIVSPDHYGAIDQILDYLFENYSNNIIKLWEIPCVTPLAHAIKSRVKSKAYNHIFEINNAFQAHLSKRLNKEDVRYRRNKLKKHGELVSLVEISSEADQLKMLDTYFIMLEKRFGNSLSRYRKRQVSSEYKAFSKNLIQKFNDPSIKPYAHVVALKFDDQFIAIDKTIRDGNIIYGLMQTYDPAFYEFSPGSILLQDSLNAWLQSGVLSNDFLRGDEDYKMRFVNTSTQLVRYTFFPSSVKRNITFIRGLAEQWLKPYVFKLHEIFLRLKETTIKGLLKRSVFFMVWYSGIAWIYQQMTKKRTRVLCYHSVSDHPYSHPILSVHPRDFKEQMAYVSREKNKSLKIEITFDDGYKDNFTHAYPVLEKNNLKAKIFLTTDFINKGKIPGWDNEPAMQALSWEDIKTMKESEIVSFGCHTKSHADLGKLDPEKMKNELVESTKYLTERLESPVTNFAYPFGKRNNYSSEVIKQLKSLGYERAYTIEEGTNSISTNHFALKRFVVFSEPLYMFKVRVSGILDDLLNIFNK